MPLDSLGKSFGGDVFSAFDSLEKVHSLNKLSLIDFVSLGISRQHPDRLIDPETHSLRSGSRGSGGNSLLSRELDRAIERATKTNENGGTFVGTLSESLAHGSKLLTDLFSGSTDSSRSNGSSLIDVVSRSLGLTSEPLPKESQGLLMDIFSSIGSVASTATSAALQAVKYQTLTNPKVQLSLAALAALAIAYPKHEKMLRNINISITAENKPKTYVVGFGEEGQERRVALKISSGNPIVFVPEPGVKIKDVNLTNSFEASAAGSKASVGFTSILGFLNVFKYYTKEKMTVYNLIVIDSSPASYLKNGPRITRVELSEGELLQVIQVRASDAKRVFNRLEESEKSKGSKGSKPSEADHVQLVTVNVDEIKLAASTPNEEKIFPLPAFDNKKNEFIRLIAHNN